MVDSVSSFPSDSFSRSPQPVKAEKQAEVDRVALRFLLKFPWRQIPSEFEQEALKFQWQVNS